MVFVPAKENFMTVNRIFWENILEIYFYGIEILADFFIAW